ncbi:DUF402 domain-containing protein [Haloplasma contractile]|uniref:DUF402 domain-containing protein n=1 Tax=Haloplasma contractile SSD-17B TaxID=1033810 RepID=F7Q1X0_9MOLU|nr:DUF402 domain-containing protein [Haloplasma contractile]ERJ12218.1 hypothetical protein HLPCO_001745 [Haloplasma contractile SSD-17B]
MNKFKIKALKYPNLPHYEWEGELLDFTKEHVVVLSKPGRSFVHHTKGIKGTLHQIFLGYFQLDEWYNVLMEIEGEQIVSYYCNISMPPEFNDHEIVFVDLDLDLAKEKEVGKWHVLDEDEFYTNSIKYKYPDEIKEAAVKALERLKDKVKHNEYPFNDEIIQQYIKK